MIKLKVTYSNEEEKEKFIMNLKSGFRIANISKEYKKEGPYKRIHMDLKTK